METKLLFPILIFLAFLCYQKPSQAKMAPNIVYISAPVKKSTVPQKPEPYLPMAVMRSGWEETENLEA